MIEVEIATRLAKSLQQYPWFFTVGIADNGLVVMVLQNNASIRESIPKTWEGVTVRIIKTSRPRPAQAV